MATRLLIPGYQQFDSNGDPVSGARLYTYEAGTSTPKPTFSDAGLTTANLNPVPADAAGVFGDVFATTGEYRLVMQTAAGVTLWTADPVDGASGAVTPGAGLRNLIENADFSATSTFGPTPNDVQWITDRWYALTQTAAIGSTAQTLQEDGTPTNIRLTQTQVAAQRFGMAQVVSSANSTRARSRDVTLSGRVRHSISAPIRYAILAWTGTADAATLDVVNNWASSTYTPGNFFIGANLNVVASGALTPSANTWTDLTEITGSVTASATNLLVIFWTENTTVQNATLDFGRIQLEVASSASAFEYLPRAVTYQQVASVAPQTGSSLLRQDTALSTVLGPYGRMPLLVNGAFDIWQLGASVAIPASSTTTATVYGPDAWCMETSANQASTISRQTAVGSTPRVQFYTRVQRNSGQTGTSVLRFQHPFEIADIVRMRGQRMTVGFSALAGANFSGTLNVKLLVGTGTEGRRTNAAAYTTETEPLSAAVVLTTSLQTFTATASAVVPTTTTQASLVFEWTPSGTAGVDDWFGVQQVWLGFEQASEFMFEPLQQVVARCQRLFSKTYSLADAPGTVTADGQLFWVAPVGANTVYPFNWSYPVTMRAVPTLTWWNPVSGASSSIRDSTGAANVTTNGTNGLGQSRVSGATSATTTTDGRSYLAHATVDARL